MVFLIPFLASLQSADVVPGFTFGKVRVQILAPDVVRIEQQGKEGFEDRATFNVVDRLAMRMSSWTPPWPPPFMTEGPIHGNSRHVVFGQIQIDVPNFHKIDGTTVRLNDQLIYTVPNGGRPAPTFFPTAASTEPVYVISDSPRIIPPAWGATPPPAEFSGPDSGWDLDNDAPDIYVFLNRPGHYDQLRKDVLKLTGPVPMPPLFAFGFIDSRYHQYTDHEALDSIDTYRRKHIPLDMFVVDTDWRVNASHGYTPEPMYFPDMPKFLQAAHQRDVRIMFNDHPEPQAPTALDPKELEYRWNGLTTLKKEGVDVWWYDRNWGVTLQSPVEGLRHEVWGQREYHDMAERAAPQQRPLIMTNVDGVDNGVRNYPPEPATHRFPIWWTGDTPAVWTSLKKAISNGVSEGEIGLLPYVNDDLGGHYQTPDPELYARYLEYGCLCPITRVHCTRGEDRHPWAFGPEVEKIVTDYIDLRYRLLPTLYSAAHNAYETGEPLLRRLDLSWPSYPQAAREDEYLLGDDILVAPISDSVLTPGAPIDPSLLHTPDGQPGLAGEFFDNQNLEGQPKVTRVNRQMHFNWENNAPYDGIPQEHFSARWTGTLGPMPVSGSYELFAIADDGVRVFVDGKPVINEWHDSDSVPHHTPIEFQKGSTHSLKVEFYQNTGKARCQLELRLPLPKTPTVVHRTVWIPPGEWQDAWTGARVTGPREITVPAPLSRTPMWLRDGGIVATTKLVQHTTDAYWRDLTLDAFVPSSDSTQTRTIYEDDGISTGYLNGDSAKTRVTLVRKGKVVTLTVAPTVGHTLATSRNLVIRVHLPKGVEVGALAPPQGSVARLLGPQSGSQMPLSEPDRGEGFVVEFTPKVDAARGTKMNLWLR